MISIRGIVLVVTFTICFSGFWTLLFNKPSNRCEMTYMYQPPEYINIEFNQPFSKPYKLYAYGEGTYAQSLWHNEYHGIPILFIPGNGGSYKQVRSLASVSLVMSYTSVSGEHFNYFSIDYNEELSAFDGDKLESQTKYLFLSIKRILSLYPASSNTQLILVGHSLGGIVAKGLLTKSYFKPYLERIVLLITLATPHKSSPIVFDLKTRNFYLEVNSRFHEQRNGSLKDLNIVSIGGGSNDKLVREDLISLESEYPLDRSTLTTGMNDIWVASDHLCIVWCRQLTVKLNRLFYDLIKPPIIGTSLKLIDSSQKRQDIIDFHFFKRFSTKKYPFIKDNDKNDQNLVIVKKKHDVFYSKTVKFILHNDQRLIRINHTKVIESKYHLIPLKFRESIVVIFEGKFKHGLFSVCRASLLDNDHICQAEGFNLENYTTLVPSSSSDVDRYELHIQSTEFVNDGYTHLVIQITPSPSSVRIIIDRFTTSIRRNYVSMPSMFSSIILGENFHYIWQAYSLTIVTTTCYRSNSVFRGYGKLLKPETELSEYVWRFEPNKYSSLNMTLLRNSNNENLNLNFLLYLEPNCGYRITAKYSITSGISQILRHYSSFLILIGVSTIMLIIGIMLFNPMYIFAIPNREYSEFLKNLPKLNQCQRAMDDKCCVIFMNIFQVMTSGRYFLYFYTQIILYVAGSVALSNFFTISEDISRLQALSPLIVLTITSILFLLSYSIIFVFSALVHHLSNNFSITFNVFSRKMRFFLFLTEWKIFKAFLDLKWSIIYASGCLILFVSLLFSFFQANFFLIHMLFTILMLARFITLNHWESRIGRTTTTSYIRSIYPVIYGLQLIIALLHIPQTIDILPLVLTGKRFETFEWIIASLPSIFETIFYFSVYLILLCFPMKIDVRLENVHFPYRIRKLAFVITILGAFINFLSGSFALSFINLSIFLIFLIILLQRKILYRLINSKIKND